MTIIYTRKSSTSIPALTDGSVPFYSSGTLAEDTSNLSWNNTLKGLGLGVSVASVAARLHIGGNRSAASWTTNGIGIRTDSVTVTNTTSSGTVALQTQHGIGTPTFAASSSTTFSDASTVYISAAPIAGTNVTITRPWAQYVASGQLYIADGLRVGTTSQTSTIRFASTMTATNAAANAIYGTGAVNMTSATSVQSAALTGDNSISGNQNNSNTTGMTGVEGITRSSNTATVTSLIGVKATGVNSGAGTVTNLYNMRAFNAINSGGGTITNLFGFYSDDLTTGTNNFGSYLNVSSGSNKWNLYANGTATNYMNGTLMVGTTSVSTAKVNVITSATDATVSAGLSQSTLTMTADTSSFFTTGFQADGLINQGAFNNTVSTGVRGGSFSARASGASGTVSNAQAVIGQIFNTGAGVITTGFNFRALNATNSGGGTLTNLYGFYVDNLTTATNNYAYGSAITSGTNKWNLYMSGSADNYLAGNLAIGLNSSISAKLHVISTTEQKRIGYDASNYFSTTVSSTGQVTLDAVGSGARFVFSDLVNFTSSAPANASSTGTTGDFTWASGFLYICVGTNSWQRVATASW